MESSVSFEKGNEEAFQMVRLEAFREGCIHLKIDLSSTEVLEGDKLDGNHKISALRLQVIKYNPFSASTMETFWLFLLELAKGDHWKRVLLFSTISKCYALFLSQMLDDNKKVRAKLRELDQSFSRIVHVVRVIAARIVVSGAAAFARKKIQNRPLAQLVKALSMIPTFSVAAGWLGARMTSGICQEAPHVKPVAARKHLALMHSTARSIALGCCWTRRKWKLLIEAGQREPPFGLAVRGSTLRSVGRLVEKVPPELRIWFT
ncbi:G patch domain-containing protein 1, partial [Perkinsus olseni]